MISEQTIHEGTVDRSFVYPREIMGEALRLGSTRIICAHNHPSGSAQPSRADLTFTKDLVYAALPLDVDVLEHMIISRGDYFSFAEAGYIQNYYREYELNRHHV